MKRYFQTSTILLSCLFVFSVIDFYFLATIATWIPKDILLLESMSKVQVMNIQLALVYTSIYIIFFYVLLTLTTKLIKMKYKILAYLTWLLLFLYATFPILFKFALNWLV